MCYKWVCYNWMCCKWMCYYGMCCHWMCYHWMCYNTSFLTQSAQKQCVAALPPQHTEDVNKGIFIPAIKSPIMRTAAGPG